MDSKTKNELSREYYHRKGYVYHQERYQDVKSNPKEYNNLRSSQRAIERKYSRTAKGMLKQSRQEMGRIGKDFNFSLDDMNEALTKPCFCCDNASTRVLRVDFDKGFTPDNVLPACGLHRPNTILQNKPDSDLVAPNLPTLSHRQEVKN